MVQRINLQEFKGSFLRAGRKDQFSEAGLAVLFEYLEQYEADTGELIELDVISLCCDYFEDSLDNVLKSYLFDSLEELQDNTLVLIVDDETVICQAF